MPLTPCACGTAWQGGVLQAVAIPSPMVLSSKSLDVIVVTTASAGMAQADQIYIYKQATFLEIATFFQSTKMIDLRAMEKGHDPKRRPINTVSVLTPLCYCRMCGVIFFTKILSEIYIFSKRL